MSDLLDLYLSLVHLVLRAVDRAVEGLGLQGGWLDRFLDWLSSDADVAIAAVIAALVAAAWAGLAGAAVSWLDLRVRARLEGRVGPSYRGLGGVMQGWADWAKLMLRRPRWRASSAGAALAGALVIAALVLVPVGGVLRVVDPAWGLIAATAMLAVAPLPLVYLSPGIERNGRFGVASFSMLVMVLAVAAPLIVAGDASADGVVGSQGDDRWFAIMSPASFLLFLYCLWLEAGQLEQGRALARRTGVGDTMALARYAMAGRQYALGLLGAVVFLGGWAGPVADGCWWTLLKAAGLAALASFLGAVYPTPSARRTVRAIMGIWFPLAAVNLLVIAVLLEVM